MKYKYAVYCSGNASRLFRFYDIYSFENFPLNLIYYDGMNAEVEEKLKSKFDQKTVEVFSKYDAGKNITRKKSESVSEELNELLKRRNIDYVYCFGNQILNPELVNKFKNRIINFHPSILPSFPGLNAIDQALQALSLIHI